MTCELIPGELTDEQKGQIFGVLSVGCDRQTAANFVGCSLASIRRAMQQDKAFAEGVCRAEAGAELNHMRNVQQAAKDEKNWRASIWWLERRAPERYGPRGPGVVTPRQLKAFLEILADCMREEVRSENDRRQILARLKSLSSSVHQMLRDSQMNLGDLPADPTSNAAEDQPLDVQPDDYAAAEAGDNL